MSKMSPKCQTSDGSLRYGRVVPHPAPKNVKKKSQKCYRNVPTSILSYSEILGVGEVSMFLNFWGGVKETYSLSAMFSYLISWVYIYIYIHIYIYKRRAFFWAVVLFLQRPVSSWSPRGAEGDRVPRGLHLRGSSRGRVSPLGL